MKRLIVWAVATGIIGGCGAGGRHDGAARATASMSFGEFGKIRDWRGEGANALYLESDSRQWYYATFTETCANLPSSTHIELGAAHQAEADKFDSIQLLGEVCYFKTFDRAPGPPA
jgi:hypothetical protein